MDAPQHEDVIAELAAACATRYAKRVFWVDPDELRQEALLVAYECRRTWDPAVGVSFAGYAWRICALRLRDYLWRNSSPVSAAQLYLTELRGLHRAELSTDYVDVGPAADDLVDELDWQTRLRDQLMFLFYARGSESDAKVAIRVLLDEEKPAEVAAEMEMPITRVYRIAHRARTLMRENAMLFDLWKERTDDDI